MDRLERLLEPGALLRGPLLGDLLASRLRLLELTPGQDLGAFRIIRELGRGGMGIVYLATRADGAYEQQVAIKWLPIGKLDTLQAEQFRRERRIHARLGHPGIARLLDGGCSDDGHLWFALEHVEGLPVDQHAARHRLGWEDRIRLLLPVIEAVQFAHAQLLVHRDIKPDNVLVDAAGQPKLIDFGIATMLADAALPAACTPAFASPEQVAGDAVGTASDIWQLGNLLHCVLHAANPGQAAPRYPRDLQAVIAKARQPDVERRYATAAALLVDLRHVLGHRPVSARRAGPIHRLALLARAHPVGTAISTVAALLFTVTIAGFLLRLTHERDSARRAQNVAEQVNAFLLQDFLPGADPLQGGSSDVSVAELGIRALDLAETRLGGIPQVAGRIEASLGDVLGNLGKYRAARRAYARAIVHLRTAYGAQDAQVLRARLNLEMTRIDPAGLKTADARLLPLRADILQALGPADPLLLDADAYLARAAFLRDDFRLCKSRYLALLPRTGTAGKGQLGDLHIGLSLCQSRLGDWEDAIVHARQAQRLNEHAFGREHPLALEAGIAVETALLGAGRYAEASAISNALAAQLTQRYGPLHPTTLMVRHDQGLATSCAGDPVAGARLLRDVAGKRARILGSHHPWLAMTESVLAMALRQSGADAEAAAALARARAALGNESAALPYIQLTLLQNEADLALARRDFPLAMRRYRAALQVAGKVYPEAHRGLASLQVGQGLAMLGDGQTEAGKALIGPALAVLGQRNDCRHNMLERARRTLQ